MEGGSPALPSLRCSSSESPPAASASAGGFSRVSPLPGPPWCAPRCASPWVCGHVCLRWASPLSRPAWQQAFTRACVRVCVCVCVCGGKKKCASLMCVCVSACGQRGSAHHSYGSLSTSISPRVETLSILPPLSLHKAAGECVCERVCERGRGITLCLSSLCSSVELAAPPPSLPHSLTSVRGLNQVTGLM